MKKKKLILLMTFFAVLVLLVFQGFRILILSVGVWEYYRADEYCPRGASPLILYEVKPYVVITNVGHMYLGDEYEVSGDGIWYGIATLLFAGNDGATFVVKYPSRTNEGVLTCRWFAPVGDYR